MVNRLFRAFHTLKGMSGMLEAAPVGELAHGLEDLLDAVRMGRVRLDDGLHALLEEGTEGLASFVGALQAGTVAEVPPALLRRIARHRGGVSPAA